jgi:phenylacetate-CoA ligase
VKDTQEYWNPVLETLPRDKLRRLQLKKFQRIMRWAYDNSKFYHKLYSDAGIVPGEIKTFEDIRKVPKIEKSMMRSIQGKDPFPYGDILCVPVRQVTTYRQTSGTTGQPVYEGDTWQDWDWGSEAYCYALYAQGYRDTDRLFLPFGYNIFIAFWTAHYAGEKLGCEVIPGGVLNTEARILKMKELRATAMGATPSYVLSLGDVAVHKLGINPAKEMCIRKITCAGEPGGSIGATKKRIEETWGAKVFDQTGSTEAGHWGFQCRFQDGVHVNEAFFLAEIEDRDTGELITEPNKPGKLVITSFDRMAQPCIRFDCKDIVKWSDHQCECGRTFGMFDGGIIGRADDITKVKGVLFAPTTVEEVVRGMPELTDEYQILVCKKGEVDDITLTVELTEGQESNIEAIKLKLADELRIKTNLGYNFEFCKSGTLPRFEGKAKRFKDLRHEHETEES